MRGEAPRFTAMRPSSRWPSSSSARGSTDGGSRSRSRSLIRNGEGVEPSSAVCRAPPVLKTGWATGPGPLQAGGAREVAIIAPRWRRARRRRSRRRSGPAARTRPRVRPRRAARPTSSRRTRGAAAPPRHRGERRERLGVVAVAAAAARDGVLALEQRQHAVDRRHGRRVDHRRDAARAPERVQVAEQPEAGDVGHRVRAGRARRGGCAVVERRHRRDREGEQVVVAQAALARGRDRADAERLGEDEHVARARPRVGDQLVGMHGAGDRHPVLRLGIVDRMPADDRDPGRRRDVRAAAQDLAQDVPAELLEREGDDVHRRQRHPAHRVDVRQRVRRRDPAEVVGVVDDRREEVDRHHERDLVGQLEHRGVVSGIGADEQPRRLDGGQPPDDRQQRRCRQLASAARAVRKRRQRDRCRGVRLAHGRTAGPGIGWASELTVTAIASRAGEPAQP